ncbi:glycosyltransferase family 4 protein [Pseudonocardia sp. KRD291]|uniref:glycosyltransferase family 4 protein n=1 Tax=Pseudonocardia sp. KRD291 TaxID=2792007 RepID=UPI001C4A0327|nr:glycosyltransferase family 4 protein [Pseudonocardia sp. KRD291]MBW0101555.1 glycosyltransferase family 4 protein [Pseudonocardia sp. KRD291]
MPGIRPIVVHVSTVHFWDDSRIFRRMCLSLARHGYDVVLLAVADAETTVGDVRVVPVGSGRGRLARLLVDVPRVAVRAWSMRAALYHLHDPELIPLVPLLRLRGAEVIYDAHEDLPLQVLEKEYLPRAVKPAVAAVARFLCRFADRTSSHVLAASPKVADQFRATTCTVVRNYPEDIPEGRQVPEYRHRDPVVVYAGGLTRARGVEQMVDALPHAELPPDWRLLLVGPHSPDDLIDRLRIRSGWDRVDHRGSVSAAEARRLIGTARIGLALLQPIGQYVDVLPTKLFEYMAVGVPVVAADYPQCRDVVQSAGCGFVVDPTDPRAIGEAVAELARHPERAQEMGERGRAEVARRFNWGVEERGLLAAYSRVLGDRVGRPA